MQAVKSSPSTVSTTTVTPTRPWSKEECTQEKVQAMVLKKFQAIVDHAEARTAALKAYEAGDEEYKKAHGREVAQLLKGYWYANEYCRALTITGQTPRLDHFKKTGAFYHGFPPSGFDTVSNRGQPGGKRPWAYVLKQGVSPTSGLKSIREGVVPEEIVQEYVKKGEEAKTPKSSVALIDCQEAIQIAYYETLLEIWGEETFNRKFSADGPTPLSFDIDTIRTPLLLSFMTEQVFDVMTKEEYDETKYNGFYDTIQKGDELFFRNTHLYSVKKPHGEAGGYHCMRSQGGVIAFGASERSDEQMLELLADEFNGPDIENTVFFSGDFFEKMQMVAQERMSKISSEIKAGLQALQITAELIKTVHRQTPTEAGLVPLIRRLDAEKIRSLLKK